MKKITQLGATTQEAISLALQKLKCTQEQVEIKVLQESKKGFLGFGSRPAEVVVSVKIEEEKVNESPIEEIVIQEIQEETVIEETSTEEVVEKVQSNSEAINKAIAYLTDIAKGIGIEDLRVKVEEKGKYITLRLESEKAALLIGKRGQTLNALQQLTQLVMNQYAANYIVLKLDVENYRERRQESLEQLAERMADRAVRTRQKVEFEPMPSYERKIIHHTLTNRLDIETYSVGTEPNRYLVIEPIK